MSPIQQSEPATEPPTLIDNITVPPGNLWSDEPPLESDLHRDQIDLLIRLMKWLWRDRADFYVTGNLTIYYSPNQLKSEFFRGPDFFVVLGTEKKDRRSWVLWDEQGKYPNVIVELLSDSTAKIDKGLKKEIYQDTFRTPDYFWFHPNTLEFAGFHLVDGTYQALEPNPQGWLWSQQLGLYLGIDQNKLRFFTSEGEKVLLPEEEMEQRAEQERQRAEQERQRADRLAEKLRDLGVDPEMLA
ncbi:Uma2 family endonuclease [Kovacikia minuta CCNUW1]|uniref:Uma2 family endonuclease n=1 Tax=Kovacikia minuta TaxID=2931930 RepID=UPI001CCB3B89|nr:Uma2 family endonuclease [Kovacikia minuta]UBF25908.1 Uma2 family endonuclease [Kovacikia minuta CCNUW1]